MKWYQKIGLAALLALYTGCSGIKPKEIAKTCLEANVSQDLFKATLRAYADKELGKKAGDGNYLKIEFINGGFPRYLQICTRGPDWTPEKRRNLERKLLKIMGFESRQPPYGGIEGFGWRCSRYDNTNLEGLENKLWKREDILKADKALTKKNENKFPWARIYFERRF